LKHAYDAELETNRAAVLLLDELDRLVTEVTHTCAPIVRPGYCLAPAKYHGSYGIRDNFLAIAIHTGLYHYVAYRIECQPDIIRKNAGRPFLEYAVLEKPLDQFGALRLSSKMVQLLLQNGSCPNQIYERDSAWDIILRRFANHGSGRRQRGVVPLFYKMSDPESPELLQIVRIFIEHGAVVNKDIYEKISRTFKAEFPEETKRLQGIMVAKGALKEENQSTMVRFLLDRKASSDPPV
jgi:hypothetical protein